MKPEASLPQVNPENLSRKEPIFSAEGLPDLDTQELGVNKSEAVFDADNKSHSESLKDFGPMAILPAPTSNFAPQDDNVSAQQAIYPLIANDDDLIEKEWVDKAKKILADTKDDPYLREKEVSKLQVDYIKKRYGRELGEAA